jgi:Zn-dependent M28 family amino/carboxypeptidase
MKISSIATFAFIAVALLTSSSWAQQSTQRISTEDEIKEDLNGPCKNSERVEAVKKLFIKMGAPAEAIKSEKTNGNQNVVYTKKGKSEEIVVVGAHLDKVSDGCGIIDNWSGIVILAHLIRTLSSIETQKTYIFAAFDREEEGLKGSAAMAKAIPKEARAGYCSMVNLDSFGLGYPVVLDNASSSKMTKFAKELGAELKVSVTPLNIPGANSDSSSFNDKDIPAITLSALSAKWPQYLHSPNDKLESVIPGSVRVGYHFAREYIARIDAGACNMFR